MISRLAGRLRVGARCLFATTIFLLVLCLPADAIARQAKSRQVRVAYESPAPPEHAAIHDSLRRRRSLEQMGELLSPLRLPRPLLLKAESCGGEANAWYAVEEITICYDYLAFMLLQLPREDARRMIGGIAHGYAAELGLRDVEDLRNRASGTRLAEFASVHASPVQRMFNVLCMAYGADPAYFSAVVDRGVLPESRAAGCVFEFLQVAYAWRKLIQPHVDAALARRVLDRRWVPEAGTKPSRR